MAGAWKAKNREFNLRWKKLCEICQQLALSHPVMFALSINEEYYWWCWEENWGSGVKEKCLGWVSFMCSLEEGRGCREGRTCIGKSGQRFGQIPKGRKKTFWQWCSTERSRTWQEEPSRKREKEWLFKEWIFNLVARRKRYSCRWKENMGQVEEADNQSKSMKLVCSDWLESVLNVMTYLYAF